MKDVLSTMSEAEADRGLSEWFGAIFYFFANRGKVPFVELNTKKYQSRNIWTGYFLKLFLAVIGIVMFWRLADYLYP
ncbi:MAG: hypothetical protein ACI9XO_001192 [Paraglaciecola sp.]|jgi:hypothetical protein